MPIIYGTNSDDLLYGTDVADELYAGEGADQVYGGAGNGYIVGGAGNDYVEGGTGADYMRGGLGDDVYIVDDSSDDQLRYEVLAGQRYFQADVNGEGAVDLWVRVAAIAAFTADHFLL